MTDDARFANDEIKDLLAANGLENLDDAFRVGELLGQQHLRRATRHKNKHVVKFDLQAPSGTTTVYIKRQWRRERLFPRPTDFRHRINLLCSPIHEWRGLRMLEGMSVNVSQPLAVFWRGWGLSRGAVVTRSVPPELSMADLLLSGRLLELPKERLNAMIAAAVEMIVRMHKHGISWRSMKAKHFYPEEFADGSCRMWLIDCEGVYRWASRRDCEREWKTFVETLTHHTPSLQKPLFAAYEREVAGDRNESTPDTQPLKKSA